MIVMKFGGTSVGDGDRIRGGARLAARESDRSPVVVCSAMAGVTDQLLSVARVAEAGEDPTDAINRIGCRHREALSAVAPSDTPASQRLEGFLCDLMGLARGVSLIRECSPRTTDALLAYGELLSTTIVAAAIIADGVPAEWHDARRLIVTDGAHTAAEPDMSATRAAVLAGLRTSGKTVVVTQGFIGATAQGVTTTLGRGGSDYTAGILGAILGAERVEIWTDVDGILNADPRLVENCAVVPEMDYDEAAELAFFGAKVVHPATIQPAVDAGVPVFVRNTLRPEGSGTRIARLPESRGIRALAGRDGIAVVTVQSSRMLNAYGFLQRLFAVFADHRVPVDLVATSEVSVSVTVDERQLNDQLEGALGSLGHVTIERGKAILSLVGRGVWREADALRRVFSVIDNALVRLISLGSSDTNLCLVLPAESLATSMTLLHREFFS